MLRPIPDLPVGVVGFDVVGGLDPDDYRDTLHPAIVGAAGQGEVRLVLVIGDDVSAEASEHSWEGVHLDTDHRGAWARTAVVSDLDWVRHLVPTFGWLVPGEIRRFAVEEREAAIVWAAGLPEPEPETAPDDQSGIAAFLADPAADAAAVVDPTIETAPVSDATAVMAAHDLHADRATTPNPDVEVQPVVVASAPVATPAVPAQWASDPHGRHQHRWWDGERWTAYVADNGITTTDPFG